MVRFTGSRRVLDVARDIGEMPIPPYVHEPLKRPDDYQTVYAAVEGAIAAPTAGLHFTPTLLDHIEQSGVHVVTLTLHIGWGTFRPVDSDDPRLHRMDAEWYEVSDAAAATLKAVQGRGRVVVVGTSAVRTLETVASVHERVRAGRGWSELFIYPGYRFAVTDALVTNFHLPKTTLLMLVCAFAGRDLILRAYREAIAYGYRFYSFGDAMLIL
jgi:S-adenosylmethionine:tRNA ribosyltransferase-isomerase